MRSCCKKKKCCELQDASPVSAGGTMFPLALAKEGEKVEVVTMGISTKIHERLLSMGIGVGDALDVLKCQEHGTVLIAKGKNRYALGGGMAQKIYVR